MTRAKKIVSTDTEITKTVSEMDQNVTESPVIPEIIDDTPAVIEPKTLTLEQKFTWNFEDMKANLTAHIEKYSNLVVTEENLKSMEKTQKEIASLRTKISKFRLAVKNDLEKPYKVFEQQIKELLDLVFSVEKPIKDQLEIYENKRREKKSQIVQSLIDKISAELGLEERYSQQIAIDHKWLNRTTTKKEITEGIQERVCWFLDIQAKDHQAALFAAQKKEMSKLLCQSLSADLATPLTYEEIEKQIEPMTDILAVKSFIENEVAQRKEREQCAARLAIEKAGPPVSPSINIPNTLPRTSTTIPPISPSIETWDVVLRMPDINLQQSVGFQKYLSDNGIRYEVVSQQRTDPQGAQL